jgi:hypothetical protein
MANSTHVEISGGASRFAGKARGLIDQVRLVSNDASTLLAICNSYLGAAPNLALDATYADLAVALGLTGDPANAQARTFYTLLAAAQGRLTGSQISAFVDQLG